MAYRTAAGHRDSRLEAELLTSFYSLDRGLSPAARSGGGARGAARFRGTNPAPTASRALGLRRRVPGRPLPTAGAAVEQNSPLCPSSRGSRPGTVDEVATRGDRQGDTYAHLTTPNFATASDVQPTAAIRCARSELPLRRAPRVAIDRSPDDSCGRCPSRHARLGGLSSAGTRETARHRRSVECRASQNELDSR
jgi:hypothetical protein